MEQLLTFKKLTKNEIFIDNIFYGKAISFSFPCDAQSFSVSNFKHAAKFSVALKLTIGGHACSLFLETLPPLVTFSGKFTGIDLFSVPQEIRLLVFQTATEALCSYFSDKLKAAITVDAIEILMAYDPVVGLDFVITAEQKYLLAGTLATPKEVLVLLAKHITDTPRLRDLSKLEMSYHVCVGTTYLTRENYRNLCEEDIVFLDQHELANQKKVDILGLGRMRIHGSCGASGVVVRRISEVAQCV
jgi:hypothetical protein